MKAKKKTKLVINIILSILAVIWLFPAVFAIFNIFKSKQEYNLGTFWALPTQNMLLDNIAYIREGAQVFSGMFNSLLYAVLGAFLAVCMGMLAAYGLSHMEIKHKMFWFLFIYSGTIFPFQIYLIPIYKAYTKIGFYDTRTGMILFYTAICIPFCMFVLRNFFLGISKEICESSKVDGATDFQILMKVFVPMAKAPIAIVFLAQFTWVWNDLMFGLTFTKSAAVKTVMAGISIMDKGNVPVLFLACIIASIPTLVLFTLLQKNFEAGFVYTSK